MLNIAIFASGNGSNAQNIIEYFENSKTSKIALVLSNKKDAFVLERASRKNIPVFTFNSKEFNESEIVINKLKEYNIGFIVLAGFLLKVPSNITSAFYNKIINIHPALLPKYGGKGMFGMNVHNAVIEAGEAESGITIHYVNENYDEGRIIFQAKVQVNTEDTPESLAEKIHILEYQHFPAQIEKVISENGYAS
jgi:phosphoribosylglycinamide formyltransferase-1